MTYRQQNQQQSLISESVERFLRERRSIERRNASIASELGFSRDDWLELAALGALGLPVAERDGGLGGSLSEVMAVMRLFGKALVVEPYVACVIIAGRLAACSEDDEQRNGLLSPLIDGTELLGLAHWERGSRFGAGVCHTHLTKLDGRWLLNGSKFLVPIPHALHRVLATARDEGGEIRICAVPLTAQGVTMRPYRTVDNHCVGDVTFTDVCVEQSAIMVLPDASKALHDVLTYAAAALCAEAVGCTESLLDMTVDYAKSRKQFGKPIATFQVIKHRLVDCYTRCLQCEGMMRLASMSDQPEWEYNVAAAKSLVSDLAMQLGHEAIQIHGGMGLSDELLVSHYHKRLVAIGLIFGDSDCYTDHFAARREFKNARLPGTALAFDRLLTTEDRQFRQEVRDFLHRQLPSEVRHAVRVQTSSYPEKFIGEVWQARLRSKGWQATQWPAAVGGVGWSAVQRFVFEYECALAGAPEPVPMGFRYVGPVIARFGTEQQKAFFLPKLLSGEHYWAQGFSEVGAGSDLAALKTSAELRGDHYVVNGGKMWTTHAHFANWLFCIVRTARSEKPQEGISFMLIDLATPGITIKPIPLLAVDHEVNQLFFDDVRVPTENLIGAAGRGWEYTKFLLDFERGGMVFSGRLRHELNLLKDLITASDSSSWTNDVARSVAKLEFRLMALELCEFQFATEMQSGEPPGVAGSAFKLLASELQKDITEAAMRAAGFAGLEFERRRPLYGPEAPPYPGFDLERTAMPRYLNLRVASIFGGSSEIQREILAKHVLDLR